VESGGGSDEESDGESDEGSDDGETEVREDLRAGDHVLSSEFPIHFYDAETEDYQGRGAAYVQAHSDHVHWHSELEVPVDGQRTFRIEVVDRDRETIPVGSEGDLQLDASLTEDTPDDFVDIAVQDDLVHFIAGSDTGEGSFVLDLLEGGEVVWTAPPTPLAIVSEV